jgi:hypothetical protein
LEAVYCCVERRMCHFHPPSLNHFSRYYTIEIPSRLAAWSRCGVCLVCMAQGTELSRDGRRLAHRMGNSAAISHVWSGLVSVHPLSGHLSGSVQPTNLIGQTSLTRDPTPVARTPPTAHMHTPTKRGPPPSFPPLTPSPRRLTCTHQHACYLRVGSCHLSSVQLSDTGGFC